MTKQAARSIQYLVKYAVMLCIAFIALFPIVWMCIISLKTPTENISGFNSLFVLHPTLRNYIQLFKQIPIGKNFFNSIFTTAIGTVTTVYFCALAGFAFAKYRFPGRDVLFYFVIATMLIPPEVGAVPQFLIMRRLHFINSLWSLIVPKIATAVGIFYMRQYILDVPDELLEAARIDGCKDFGIFNKIMFPVIVPALISWASLTIVARWNDFFWPMLFLRKAEKYTLMISISLLPVSDGLSTPWPVILAGTTVVIIPIIVVYLIFQMMQKHGSLSGAVKG
ncbi:carbohydrate ABC transporter permease [Treponema sp. Marseille-Q4132]|uniref:carbohydrate ABC transporter permease n=1 Tax=Treponema sp. Marseille-Q4132 TaxID=2766701 RepID=UPI001652C0E8|nr:carbohydrate ABC transporter permease [Treponema sp. Marseille-Q4132]QNL96611.1 carbohydrate ABC transporter permease [Treponema sp. Marseille-Q4132]